MMTMGVAKALGHYKCGALRGKTTPAPSLAGGQMRLAWQAQYLLEPIAADYCALRGRQHPLPARQAGYCAFFCCDSKARSVRSTSARNGASTRSPSTSK